MARAYCDACRNPRRQRFAPSEPTDRDDGDQLITPSMMRDCGDCGGPYVPNDDIGAGLPATSYTCGRCILRRYRTVEALDALVSRIDKRTRLGKQQATIIRRLRSDLAARRS